MPRLLIAEGYNPPFYPVCNYDPEKALRIAQRLNADGIRFPAAAYYAYYPTSTPYPVHPDARKTDLLANTVEAFHKAGLKVVAYLPLNHPFMEIAVPNPDFQNWMRRFPDGKPMTTRHYGFAEFYESCLTSPLREVMLNMVREVLTRYEVDVLYFDGPYQGMDHGWVACHCEHCQRAYQEARGKRVPVLDSGHEEEDREYIAWMRDDVAAGFVRDIRSLIRTTRDIPVLYNNTALLGRRQWRSRVYPHFDGFMFEAADSPEQKLFNIQLGRSTGKTIWTYVGTYAQYNREHLHNRVIQGWFSYPVESEELLLDGAMAMAAGAGLVYWGVSRFFDMEKDPLEYESGRHVRSIFDFVERNRDLLAKQVSVPAAGVVVGSQTIDWCREANFELGPYRNYYYGAFSLLKDLGYDSEPILDYSLTSRDLSRYRVLYLPNAACLSVEQCEALKRYVAGGGVLVATHLTSFADELGRPRKVPELSAFFGIRPRKAGTVEAPDLYLRTRAGEMIPQDPQIVPFDAVDAEMLAETWDRGHMRTAGPAVVRRAHGKGWVIYIGSGLEAVYEETRMRPLRDYMRGLLAPYLEPARTYQVEFRAGLTCQLMKSGDTLLLHLLANVGNKLMKSRAREQYVPLANLNVRVRVPAGRTVRNVSLLKTGKALDWKVRDGWAAAIVPEIRIHDAVRVDLA